MKRFSPVMPYVLLWMLDNLNIVFCKGVLIIKFDYYVNTQNMIMKGDHYCDGSRYDACETYLRIWLDDGNTRKYWVTDIHSYSNANYYFTNRLNKDKKNPVHWRFTDFQPVYYEIEAWDSDCPVPNERADVLLDRYRGEFNSAPKNKIEDVYAKRYSGSNDRYIKMQLEMKCNKHYYGDICQVHCEPPKNEFLHFKCNSEGELVCKQNYFGSNCTLYCKSRDDYGGHYTCGQNGNKICLENYYGPSCTIHCKPRNDEWGHYSCSNSGVKICHQDYFGSDCTTYCSPRNNTTRHYASDEYGNKVCLENYYGPSCAKHCVPQEKPVKFDCDEDGNKIYFTTSANDHSATSGPDMEAHFTRT